MRRDFLLCLDGRFFDDVIVDRPIAPAVTAEIAFTRDPRKALEGNELGWSVRAEGDSKDVPIYIVPGSVEPASGGGRYALKAEVHSGPIYDLF
jgi:hypothetical protein